MEWFKALASYRTDPKLALLTDDEHRAWFNLLCYASEQSDRWDIDLCNDSLLAIEVCRGDEELLRRTIKRLEQFQIITIGNESLHRYITFTGADELHRRPKYPSDAPERVAERVRKHRLSEIKTDNVTSVTSCNEDVTACNELDKSRVEENKVEKKRKEKRDPQSQADSDIDFDIFWSRYPGSRPGKIDARKCWNARMKEGVAIQTLIDCTGHYAEVIKCNCTEPHFIMHPSKFIGVNKRYLDFTDENWEQQIKKGNGNGLNGKTKPNYRSSDPVRNDKSGFASCDVSGIGTDDT